MTRELTRVDRGALITINPLGGIICLIGTPMCITLRLFEMGLPRRGMFCIILVYPIARARGPGVVRCMLTWRYAGLRYFGGEGGGRARMHFLRIV